MLAGVVQRVGSSAGLLVGKRGAIFLGIPYASLGLPFLEIPLAAFFFSPFSPGLEY
jgi:hypothetical protein